MTSVHPKPFEGAILWARLDIPDPNGIVSYSKLCVSRKEGMHDQSP